MQKLLNASLAVLLVVLAGGWAVAHFHTYWPDGPNCYARRGREVKWTYFWGHPYERAIFDALKPNFYIIRPDGSKDQVTVKRIKLKDEKSGKMRTAFEIRYTPRAIGDHFLCLEAQEVFIEEEGVFWKDYVKQCLHVMAQKGWDRVVGHRIELVPLVRPYGLEPGFVFKARALLGGQPLAGATVEIEKFNGFYVPEEKLPKDQYGNEDVPMITRVVKTDVNGYVSFTLDEPGWWVLCVSHEDGYKEHAGREYPVLLRGCFWVHVQPKFDEK